MVKLRKDVVHEDFENKAKFPLALKPTVLEAGLIMLRKNKEIDENLVYHLMSILPYNRFTLKVSCWEVVDSKVILNHVFRNF